MIRCIFVWKCTYVCMPGCIACNENLFSVVAQLLVGKTDGFESITRANFGLKGVNLHGSSKYK